MPIPDLIPPNPALNRRAHRIATGLLVLMAVLYALAKTFEKHHPAWGFLRAFAEAGMIGALADWFAVVALFRHPLGLTWIPHTAIIAKRKDQISESLARFVEQHFLSPTQITARIERIAIVERASTWLQQPGNAEKITDRIAATLPGILEALDDTDMRRFLRDNLLSLATRTPAAPIAGRLLSMLVEKGRHQELLQSALHFGKTILDDNVTLVEERIEIELRKVPRVFGIRRMLVKRTARKIVDNIQASLDSIVAEPDHPMRDQFHHHALDLIHNLEHSPDWLQRLENLKQELLANTTLAHSLDALWTGIKRALIADLSQQQSAINTRLAASFRDIGRSLERDEAFRNKLNLWLKDATHSLATNHSHEIGNLIRDTARQWDGEEMSAKLESQVGSDLQYIRINGTLVGGLVGLLLHTLGLLIWK
ncbi:DUF445 domain-containing protein [Phragmitibacter flavus]|uniref:DUF445 domain-containing protein n=1 Tax=Phragmitibacter flavus TaxID=2576071 RepID=A0A5R8K8L9_9BACT|nr:DUF445 domain-containing protein [Phragmitibacter flavus]TLD68668.1 DUF445 domain-containing protein [Phragmitibacter flavus]